MRKYQRWLVVAVIAGLVAGVSVSAGAAEPADGQHEARGDDAHNGERGERKRPRPVPKSGPVPAPSPSPRTPTPTTEPPPPDISPGPSGKFDILLAGGDDPVTRQWWVAPYVRDLYAVGISQVPGVGWTDGDRAGYRCAYMFLYQNGNENDIVGRVTFTRIGGYAVINDAHMAEFARAYDGGLDYTNQAECPGSNIQYAQWSGSDYRPKIFYVKGGQLLENRSYTNTTGDAIAAGALKFGEYERITTPFTDTGGLASCDDYCTVYERVTVVAYFEEEPGKFYPAVAVYYDSLSPDVSLASAGPGGFEPSQPSRVTTDDTTGSEVRNTTRNPGRHWWRSPERAPR